MPPSSGSKREPSRHSTLIVSCLLFAWLTFRPWNLRQYVPPKRPLIYTRLQVVIQITLWDVIFSNNVYGYMYMFKKAYFLYYLFVDVGIEVLIALLDARFHAWFLLGSFFDHKKEVICSFETSSEFQRTTWRYIPEERIFICRWFNDAVSNSYYVNYHRF
jgi:hypothetical protein